MPFCKYCGSEHDEDAEFCTECGKPIVKKAAAPEKTVQEVPLATKTEEIVRIVDAERPYLPGDPITPEMEEEMQAYQAKVAQYTLSLTVFKQLFRKHPDLFGEEEWRLTESALAEKYGLSDISIFRQKELPDFAAEQNASKPAPRRNATYTKRDTEYWSQFDADEDLIKPAK
jgi:hypothetical protein